MSCVIKRQFYKGIIGKCLSGSSVQKFRTVTILLFTVERFKSLGMFSLLSVPVGEPWVTGAKTRLAGRGVETFQPQESGESTHGNAFIINFNQV